MKLAEARCPGTIFPLFQDSGSFLGPHATGDGPRPEAGAFERVSFDDPAFNPATRWCPGIAPARVSRHGSRRTDDMAAL